MGSAQQFDVFLSHNSLDKTVIRVLRDHLVGYGLNVWVDEDEMPPGSPSVAALQQGISASRCMIVAVGKNGLGDWEVYELEIAIKNAVKNKQKVIPVLLPGSRGEEDLPAFLATLTWVRFEADFTSDQLDRLYWGITGKKIKSTKPSIEIPVVVESRPPVEIRMAAQVSSPDARGVAIVERGSEGSSPQDLGSVEVFAGAVIPSDATSNDTVEIVGSDTLPPNASSLSTVEFPVINIDNYWRRSELPVRVLVACQDSNLQQRLNSFRPEFDRTLPVFHELRERVNFKTNESYLFDWRNSTPSRLLEDARSLLNQDQIRLVTIVSDCFADGDSNDTLCPSSLVGTLRNSFLSSSLHCGLLALVPGEPRRVRDVDVSLSHSQLQRALLAQRILKVTDGLRLKSPPGIAPAIGPTESIVVRLAQTDAEMEECLALRYQIYDRMGYLEEELDGAGCELDCYDTSAFHLMACTQAGDIVGTVRMILARRLGPNECLNSVVGPSPAETLKSQAEMVHRVALRRGAVLQSKLKRPPYHGSLPVLQSTDFMENFKQIMADVGKAAELSRLVVAPRYRGVGVSKLLARAVIAVGFSLKLRQLLLECVPGHVAMYQKLGFELIPGTHGRAQELDQEAVGMRLDILSPLRKAGGMAQRDLRMIAAGFGRTDAKMLSGSKHLCMCSQTSCWSNGRYDGATRSSCPLRERGS